VSGRHHASAALAPKNHRVTHRIEDPSGSFRREENILYQQEFEARNFQIAA